MKIIFIAELSLSMSRKKYLAKNRKRKRKENRSQIHDMYPKSKSKKN